MEKTNKEVVIDKMELTGKAKESFEKWFIENDKDNPIKSWISEDFGLVYLQTPFSSLPDSFKYGNFVDWFDSVGIRVDSYFNNNEDFPVFESCVDGYKGAWKTRPQARTAAISKANEIYNTNNQNQ